MTFAVQAGVSHYFSVGGTLAKPWSKLEQLETCNQKLAQCRGDSKCCESQLVCSERARSAFENLAFKADLANLKMVLTQVITGMQTLCENHWTGPVFPGVERAAGG